jgi:hypothetical protein
MRVPNRNNDWLQPEIGVPIQDSIYQLTRKNKIKLITITPGNFYKGVQPKQLRNNEDFTT